MTFTRTIVAGLILLALVALLTPAASAATPATTGAHVKAMLANNPYPEFAPNHTGPHGIALPPGMTLGPYNKVMPINQTPKVVPRWYFSPNVKNPPGGGNGIALPPGMTLGHGGKVVPINQTPRR